jgi:lycopene cyclase domain-containing protein
VSFLYLLGLVVSISGMVVLDRRFGLFFWRDARRAAVVYVIGMTSFLAWDLAGIRAGIFFRGETQILTGLQVAPELPIEELFFLTLLIFSGMNLFGAGELLFERRTRVVSESAEHFPMRSGSGEEGR